MMTGKRNDDGIADRLNYRYTVAILVAFAIINMNRLYTDQIKCWVRLDSVTCIDLTNLLLLFYAPQIPAFFTPNYDEYIRSVCFVQNTYYVRHSDKMPKSTDVKQASEILYYQWIPFLLIVKAFVFYIPRMSWNIFGSRSGIQLSDIVESSYDYKFPTTDAAHRQMCLNYVVDSIDQYCYDHRRQRDARQQMSLFRRIWSTGWCLTGKYLGNYLVVLYMTTKLMYISVSLFQIYLLSNMLGSNFAFYGVRVLDRLYRGRLFRRIGCLSIRFHRYSLGCGITSISQDDSLRF